MCCSRCSSKTCPEVGGRTFSPNPPTKQSTSRKRPQLQPLGAVGVRVANLLSIQFGFGQYLQGPAPVQARRDPFLAETLTTSMCWLLQRVQKTETPIAARDPSRKFGPGTTVNCDHGTRLTRMTTLRDISRDQKTARSCVTCVQQPCTLQVFSETAVPVRVLRRMTDAHSINISKTRHLVGGGGCVSSPHHHVAIVRGLSAEPLQTGWFNAFSVPKEVVPWCTLLFWASMTHLRAPRELPTLEAADARHNGRLEGRTTALPPSVESWWLSNSVLSAAGWSGAGSTSKSVRPGAHPQQGPDART